MFSSSVTVHVGGFITHNAIQGHFKELFRSLVTKVKLTPWAESETGEQGVRDRVLHPLPPKNSRSRPPGSSLIAMVGAYCIWQYVIHVVRSLLWYRGDIFGRCHPDQTAE